MPPIHATYAAVDTPERCPYGTLGARRMRSWVGKTHRWALAGLALAASACREPRAGWFSRPQQPEAVDAQAEPLNLFNLGGRQKPVETLVVVQVQFDVLRIDLPIEAAPGAAGGGVAHSRKVWNHVDELRIDAARVALLARNGLRIGVARRDDWPVMKAIFEGNGAHVIHAPQTVGSGMPLTLEVGTISSPETVFVYEPDGDLVGDTFDSGEKNVHLAYAVDPSDVSRTIIRVTPEVFAGQGSRWAQVGSELQRLPAFEGKVYDHLMVELSLGPGEFLAMGPADATRSRSVIGSRFLTREYDGRPCETILCVAPQPFWTELAGR